MAAFVDFYRSKTEVYDVERRSFSPILASVEYNCREYK